MFGGVTDIGMLFVRCGNGGISHSPLETVTAEDADIAARVLLDVLRTLRANQDESDGRMSSAFVDREFARETAFLAELVKVPSDNPPGDCAAHARARQGAAGRARVHGRDASGAVRRWPRPVGMVSATNLIVRHRFGDGSDDRAQCARRRRAARARLDASILTAQPLWRGRTVRRCSAAASRCRSRILPPTRLTLLALQEAARAGAPARRHARTALHL